MPASYSEISTVAAGNAATVTDINQYKEALEGNRDFVPFLWAKADNNIVMRVGDQVGVNYFDIQDSAGVSQFKVDSNGNITSTDVLTSTRTGRLTSDAVIGNTTLADVSGMSFSIGASEVWAFSAFLVIDADTVPDYKVGWTYPAGCTMSWGPTGDPAHNVTGSTVFNQAQTEAAAQARAGAGAGTNIIDTYEGTIVNSTTSGTIQLQFAANAVGSATMKANSHIIFTKVS